MELSTCRQFRARATARTSEMNRPGYSQAPKVTALPGLTPWMIDRNRGFSPSAVGVGHLLWKAVHPVGVRGRISSRLQLTQPTFTYLLTVCTGCYLCRPSETYVNVGFVSLRPDFEPTVSS